MKSNNSKLWFRFLNYTVITFALSIATSQAAVLDSCTTIDTDLAKHYKSMATNSSYYETYNSNKFDKATKQFYDTIARYTVMSESILCNLTQAEAQGINITTSSDGKFRTVSWDELNVGTMHHFNGFIQYQGKQSVHILTNAIDRQVWDLQTVELPKDDKSQRTIYMLIEHGIYSNTAHTEALTLYEIEDDKLLYPNLIQTSSRTTNTLGFGYSANSPDGPMKMPFFHYDPKDKVISFPVVIESEAYRYGEMTNRLIKYQFKEGFFRKI
ncbi:hypothetical protein [uncultured Psychrobacter sp.]|uniref:hypothetical protein n=1 Tax=uncultured Psychrobacter sp. TaxID=259303 RepID=UPI0034594CD9